MRNVLLMTAASMCVAVLAFPAFAADMTIKGEVVDIACATSKKEAGKGAAHAACAMVCAKKGQPVGIMTADAIYAVTGDYTANTNAKLLDFVSKNVIATGAVTEKDSVKSINVKSIKLVN